jgi:hypothetical protein
MKLTAAVSDSGSGGNAVLVLVASRTSGARLGCVSCLWMRLFQ